MSNPTLESQPCPKCGEYIGFAAADAGQKANCPHCGWLVTLPGGKTATRGAANKPPGIANVLNVIAALVIVGGLWTCLAGAGVPLGSAFVVAGFLIGGVAQLIVSANESAQRLARLELLFQELVNQRR
jgi:hypothetical protein